MALGSAFPRGVAEASIRRQLQPGTVVKFKATMDDGKVHEKRFLVLSVDARTTTLVLNSEISRFVRARPEMLKCQVMMDVASHPFMDHDSHIDCSRTRGYSTSEVVDQLVANPSWVLGQIADPAGRQVIAAMKASVTISPSDAGALCASLSSMLGP